MKKFIAMITCLIILMGILVVPEPLEVHAEENSSNSYYIKALCSFYKISGNKYEGTYYEYSFSIDKKLVGYLSSSSGIIYFNTILFDSSGQIKNVGKFLHDVKNSCSFMFDKDGVTKNGDYLFNGLDSSFTKIRSELANDFYLKLEWQYAIESSGYVDTNIPYFSSKEDALGYINGTVNIKNALNYESNLCDVLYDLEVPQNLKIKDVVNSGTGSYLNVTWEQTDENYKNWQTEIYRYTDFRYRNSVLIFSFADWKYVEDYFVGQYIVDTYKLSYKLADLENVEDKELGDRIYNEYPTDYGGIYKYGDQKLYVRNYYYDGTYRHYSNWVVMEFDSEEDAWHDPDMSTTVIEQEGSEIEVDDKGNVIQPDSNIVQDSQYTGGINENYERVDGTDLISWIKNGFGIGGDNGVLSMMGEAFSFIPGEIWAVFAAGMSMMVVVAVFKFIRG